MNAKDEAIRKVILKRVAIIEDYILKNEKLTESDKEYYKGKRDGLMQGFDLVGDTLESISIELE